MLQGDCFEADSSYPYAPVLDLLRAHFAGHAPAGADEQEPLVGELVRLLPDLVLLFPRVVPSALPQTLDPDQQKQRLFTVLTRFFTEQAAQQPLLVIVEDVHWCDESSLELLLHLARRMPEVAVYVGLPGPSSPRTLLRYAQRCGVGASLRALQAQGMGAVRLVTHVDPTDQLAALARHCRTGSASNVVGVHLYSFGGVATTAHWMNARITASAT